jgi:Effector-associated domain 1/TIR domain
MTSPSPVLQTILFLASNPDGVGLRQVWRELRDIKDRVQQLQHRDLFTLNPCLDVRIRDIQRVLLDTPPTIVHFAGNGTGEAGLIFEDDVGNPKLVDGAGFAGLFELFANDIHCVVLNGCYSDVQAKAITQHIKYVMGMQQEISPKAAIVFAAGFYDALGSGRDVEYAFKLGYAAIRMEGIAEHLTSVLSKKSVTAGNEAQATPTSQLIDATPTAITTIEVNMELELSGNQIQQLREALQRAFPSRDKLKLLVNEEFNEKLDEIVGDGPLPTIVGELIDFAEAEGRLVELVRAAIRRNPGNPKLRLFGESVGLLPSALKPVTSNPDGNAVAPTPIPPQTEPNSKTSGTTPILPKPVEIFISYSHKDDDLREELVTHLSNLRRQGKISAWHDRAIEAGSEWETQIKSKLESAPIILLLISPPFMASDYCYDIEMQQAVHRHDQGNTHVIPIILRPVDWKDSPISKLQALPKDAKPVTQWGDRDTAFLDVVNGIRKVVDSLANK